MDDNIFEFENKDGYVTLVKYTGGDEKVIVPDTFEGVPVTIIGTYAFKYSVMIEVVLPDSIECFDTNAFAYCSNLKDIILPKNLKIVRQSAFVCCSSLETITFPIKVERISPYCFDSCTSLKAVFAENEKAVFGKNALAGLWGRNIIELDDVSFHLIKSLDIEAQVKFVTRFILDWESQDNKSEILTLIKKKNLKEALFLSEYIDVIYFLLDNKIKPNLESTELYLKHHIKYENANITAVLLEYKNKSFKKEKIDAVNERKELIEIGFADMTYSEFRKLWVCSKKDGEICISSYKGDQTKETIPAQIDGFPITKLAKRVKTNYRPLEIIDILAPIKSIDDYCFSYSDLSKINLPDTLISIGDGAFRNCGALENIIIPASVKEIGENAFFDCSNLQKVTFLGDLPKLGRNVFYNTPVENDFV